jgi:hypothetical protein
MPLQKPSWALEIFGHDVDGASIQPGAPLPTLPTDNPLFQHDKSLSKNGNKLAVQAMHEGFLHDVLDWDGDFIREATGNPTLAKMRLAPESRPAKRTAGDLQPSGALAKGGTADSYRAVNKFYKATGSVREAMERALTLFSDHCSDEESSLLQRAIKSLDVPAFLTVLASCMKHGIVA